MTETGRPNEWHMVGGIGSEWFRSDVDMIIIGMGLHLLSFIRFSCFDKQYNGTD